MELLEQEDRVGDEEVAHLATAKVEDVRAPIGVLSALGIWVLVQRRAIEATECPFVLGEVRGNPVDDDADACLVQFVDEVSEVIG